MDSYVLIPWKPKAGLFSRGPNGLAFARFAKLDDPVVDHAAAVVKLIQQVNLQALTVGSRVLPWQAQMEAL